jgi:phytoene desaturase
MKTDSQARVAVVGGGLGGLAAACTLAARGHAVTLLERNAWLGGKARRLEAEGFRFDMGPTIVTMPAVLERILGEAGRSLSDELDLLELDPQWRCFFDDGSTLDLVADPGQMGTTLDAFAPGSGLARGYERFMELSRKLHRISQSYFFWKPVGSFWDMFGGWRLLWPSTLLDLLRIRPSATVATTVRRCLSDERAAQMADHFTQYVGSNPYAAPAVLCGIADIQTADGVWYPRGGTRAVPEALEKLARELGVEIRTDTSVRRILTQDAAVAGVETDDGERLSATAVVSNADSVRTHRELLGGTAEQRFEQRRRYEPACSGVVLYLGLDRAYDHLLHHCFVFSRDPEEEFAAIYERGEPAPDPTCYLCAPARSEPDVAPPGGEALYVLVHTPAMRPHHDWQELLPKYRKTILAKLARTAGLVDLEERIVVEAALTPEDIRDAYVTLDGAIYGLASHGRWTGAIKPGNRSPDVRGLYLAGGSAHPGPGMPMALMSGWIAADTLDRDGIPPGGGA